MVPMRDGVRLATDIYFPAKDGVRLEGKFPAILERTPYNFDVNPNTGEALNANRRLSVATNTVYHDREHPSHVILPIIPQSGH
jgi:predicted acyl esterase